MASALPPSAPMPLLASASRSRPQFRSALGGGGVLQEVPREAQALGPTARAQRLGQCHGAFGGHLVEAKLQLLQL